MKWEDCSFDALKGEVIESIEGAEEFSGQVLLKTASGKSFKLYHQQD